MKPRRESRREQRRPVDIKATISVGGGVVSARTRDISRSGICLISENEIPRDTLLEIKLVLSLGSDNLSEPLLLTGRTIWCTALFGKYQVGGMFVNVDTERRRFLDMFMRFADGDVHPVGHEPAPSGADRQPPPEDKDDPFRP